VEATINIIIDSAYDHPTLPPPPFPSEVLHRLLKTCTTKTPFVFKNKTFMQTVGVSMGSPLGPTFPDFYMSHLKTIALKTNLKSHPVFYFRYVDDIFAIFNSKNHIH
jgi:hypothetical protein